MIAEPRLVAGDRCKGELLRGNGFRRGERVKHTPAIAGRLNGLNALLKGDQADEVF